MTPQEETACSQTDKHTGGGESSSTLSYTAPLIMLSSNGRSVPPSSFLKVDWNADFTSGAKLWQWVIEDHWFACQLVKIYLYSLQNKSANGSFFYLTIASLEIICKTLIKSQVLISKSKRSLSTILTVIFSCLCTAHHMRYLYFDWFPHWYSSRWNNVKWKMSLIIFHQLYTCP